MPTDTLALLSSLVAIDSVNPSLVPGGAGEREIAAFVRGWALQFGLEADVLEGTPGRPSVVVRARGAAGGRTLLLCGHYDTVTVEGMRDPHTPRVEGDRLYGRGAYDMKAGVAAALLACREAAGLGLAGDVIVAAVADEEQPASASRRSCARFAPTPRSSRSPPSSRSSSPTRGSCGRRSRSPAAPRTARARTSGSTRSSRPGPSSPRSGRWTRRSPHRRIRCWDVPLSTPRRSTAVRSSRATRRAVSCAWSAARCLGPGGDGAHAAEEWVSVSDTEAVARTLVAVAQRVCG